MEKSKFIIASVVHHYQSLLVRQWSSSLPKQFGTVEACWFVYRESSPPLEFIVIREQYSSQPLEFIIIGKQYSSQPLQSIDNEKGSSDEGDVESRYEIRNRLNFRSSVHNESTTVKSKFSPASKQDKSNDVGLSVSYSVGTDEISNLKIVAQHRDLSEFVASLKDYFDKVSSVGECVSKMLKTGRSQIDQSF